MYLEAKISVHEPGSEAHYILKLLTSKDLRNMFWGYIDIGYQYIEIYVTFRDEVNSSSNVERSTDSIDEEAIIQLINRRRHQEEQKIKELNLTSDVSTDYEDKKTDDSSIP